MNRRSFLKVGAASASGPLGGSPLLGFSGKALPRFEPEAALGEPASGTDKILPVVPKSKDLAGERLVYQYDEIFSTPPAQNEAGFCQATKSVTGIAAILFPPFSCCGDPPIPTPGGDISPGNLTTCEVFLNGRMLASYPRPEAKVAYTFFPHCMVREAAAQGIQFVTHTFLPPGQRAVAQQITVKNVSRETRNITLGFDLRAGVTCKREPWYIGDPGELDNRITVNVPEGYIAFESQHTQAISVQGFTPPPNRVEQKRVLVYDVKLLPGEQKDFRYVNAIGDDREAVLAAYSRQQAQFPDSLQASEQAWDARIGAAFTPGNSEFSGSLPRLETRDPALWKLYHAGFLDILLSRRVTASSVYGPTYVIYGRGASTLSYVWDIVLTSLSIALLDPKALRILLETWFVTGMDQHYATDYISGKGVGVWYAANDMCILRGAHDYLRVTGDMQWLDKSIDGRTVLERLAAHALRWKQLDKLGHGLADYGGMDALMECVSTYIHEVASVNAGNVYGMRFVADLLDRHGDSSRAAQFRAEAKDLAARINRLLYVPGKGWWRCGQPDGSFFEVRHCYDLLTILDTMFEDLSDAQKKEMAGFFWNELQTPLWMHALSPGDADASWNPGSFNGPQGIRSDHTWVGSYIAWPPMAARGLYKFDSPSRIAGWLKNVSKTANQGTYGQAHYADTTVAPDAGGARKDPIGGWYEPAGGSFTNLVIDSIFGADMTLDRGIQVNSHLEDFDPSAKLVNLIYQGKDYTISSEGAKPAS